MESETRHNQDDEGEDGGEGTDQFLCQGRAIPARQMFLHRQDEAVGDDGHDDPVLKDRPLDDPPDLTSDGVVVRQEEEGRRSLFSRRALSFRHHETRASPPVRSDHRLIACLVAVVLLVTRRTRRCG